MSGSATDSKSCGGATSVLLLGFNIFFFLVLAAGTIWGTTKLSRTLAEIGVAPPPLTGLICTVSPEIFAVAFGALILALVAKEFMLKNRRNALAVNVGGLVLAGLLFSAVGYTVFVPIMSLLEHW